MKELWTEKYRPSDIDGYVFRDNTQREQVAQWIKEKQFHTYCLVVHRV